MAKVGEGERSQEEEIEKYERDAVDMLDRLDVVDDPKSKQLVCEKVLANTTQHMQSLARVLPYLRHRIRSVNGDFYFSNGVSGAHTLDLILELCVQQSKQTHEQLMILARELDKDEEEEESNKKFNCKKWLFLIILSGSCASLLAWGLKSVGSGLLPFRWPTWFSK